jgi:hypothetical protein
MTTVDSAFKRYVCAGKTREYIDVTCPNMTSTEIIAMFDGFGAVQCISNSSILDNADQ